MSALDALVELLKVQAVARDVYRAGTETGGQGRLGGGVLAAQALASAGRTVATGRCVHSLHGYFVSPGEPGAPIDYEVRRLRDGRSFATREVTALQEGVLVLSLLASFHIHESGLEHRPAMPEAPQPESLALRERIWGDPAFEVRRVGDAAPEPPGKVVRQHQQLWIRARGRLPDDLLLHACLATYASDLALLDAILLPHQLGWADPGLKAASLDHAVWFHRAFRVDEWLLYDQHSPSASGGRGIAVGKLYRQDGTHVASVAQECVVRLLDGATGAPPTSPPP